MTRLAASIALTLLIVAAAPVGAADVNAGARLVQANGCAGCHGPTLRGRIGPSLVGIEHRRSGARISAAIANPTAPMPKFPFSTAQIADIVAYLASLDGAGQAPVAALQFTSGKMAGVLSVRFSGTSPTEVTALPVMQMGASTMKGAIVVLHPSANRRLWTGTVAFSMSGPWTVDVVYDGRHLTVPVDVPGSP